MIKTKYKVISIFLGAAISLGGVSAPVLAVETENTSANATTTISSLQELVNSLKAQIEILIVQIAQLQEQMGVVKQTQKDILQLVRQLRRGMRGEDVENLQEILASDPEIYPEGLVTGYFGPLTEKAVSKFQKKMGVEQVGQVGPKTLAKLNQLLTEGNASGKVPPGLLIASGIRKKISFMPMPLSGQTLPEGIAKKIGTATTTPPDGDDTTVPVISGIAATSTTATTTGIAWNTDEEATSKVWYDTSTPVDIATTTTPMMSDSNLVFSHNLTLSSLTASTTYYYVVSSTDAASNEATSTEQSFITSAE